MALAITITDVDAAADNIYLFAMLTPSGSYSTGGDTLDFTTVANQIGASQAGAGVGWRFDRRQLCVHPRVDADYGQRLRRSTLRRIPNSRLVCIPRASPATRAFNSRLCSTN